MIRDWKAPILAVVGIASLAIAIPMGVANAQVSDQQPPPTQQRGQGGLQRGDQGGIAAPGGEMMQRQMMGGGGPATMVTDNQYLYVLQGNTLYKINKVNLEVLGQGQLPMPQMGRGGGGFEGAPGVRSGGGGATRAGGGGEDIPPVDESK